MEDLHPLVPDGLHRLLYAAGAVGEAGVVAGAVEHPDLGRPGGQAAQDHALDDLRMGVGPLLRGAVPRHVGLTVAQTCALAE